MPALDLLPAMRLRAVGELRVMFDGHPNARAHAIFAQQLFEYLRASDLFTQAK